MDGDPSRLLQSAVDEDGAHGTVEQGNLDPVVTRIGPVQLLGRPVHRDPARRVQAAAHDHLHVT